MQTKSHCKIMWVKFTSTTIHKANYFQKGFWKTNFYFLSFSNKPKVMVRWRERTRGKKGYRRGAIISVVVVEMGVSVPAIELNWSSVTEDVMHQRENKRMRERKKETIGVQRKEQINHRRGKWMTPCSSNHQKLKEQRSRREVMWG